MYTLLFIVISALAKQYHQTYGWIYQHTCSESCDGTTCFERHKAILFSCMLTKKRESLPASGIISQGNKLSVCKDKEVRHKQGGGGGI